MKQEENHEAEKRHESKNERAFVCCSFKSLMMVQLWSVISRNRLIETNLRRPVYASVGHKHVFWHNMHNSTNALNRNEIKITYGREPIIHCSRSLRSSSDTL